MTQLPQILENINGRFDEWLGYFRIRFRPDNCAHLASGDGMLFPVEPLLT